MPPEPGIKQYTAKQIAALPCERCADKGVYQWSACADNNLWRVLCTQCDYDLNVIVMRWYNRSGTETKLRKYAKLLGVKYVAPPKGEK